MSEGRLGEQLAQQEPKKKKTGFFGSLFGLNEEQVDLNDVALKQAGTQSDIEVPKAPSLPVDAVSAPEAPTTPEVVAEESVPVELETTPAATEAAAPADSSSPNFWSQTAEAVQHEPQMLDEAPTGEAVEEVKITQSSIVEESEADGEDKTPKEQPSLVSEEIAVTEPIAVKVQEVPETEPNQEVTPPETTVVGQSGDTIWDTILGDAGDNNSKVEALEDETLQPVSTEEEPEEIETTPAKVETTKVEVDEESSPVEEDGIDTKAEEVAPEHVTEKDEKLTEEPLPEPEETEEIQHEEEKEPAAPEVEHEQKPGSINLENVLLEIERLTNSKAADSALLSELEAKKVTSAQSAQEEIEQEKQSLREKLGELNSRKAEIEAEFASKLDELTAKIHEEEEVSQKRQADLLKDSDAQGGQVDAEISRVNERIAQYNKFLPEFTKMKEELEAQQRQQNSLAEKFLAKMRELNVVESEPKPMTNEAEAIESSDRMAA